MQFVEKLIRVDQWMILNSIAIAVGFHGIVYKIMQDWGMLNRIIPDEETWVYYYQSESKHTSPIQWKPYSSLSTKKFKVAPSTCKFMVIVFWYSKKILITSKIRITRRIMTVIQREHPELLTKCTMLHHDNVRPSPAFLI